MGTTDFLKEIQGKMIDAATYQHLERNFQLQTDQNKLLSDNAILLQATINSQAEEIAQLKKEIADLKQQSESYKQEQIFRTYKSIAFKMKSSARKFYFTKGAAYSRDSKSLYIFSWLIVA